MTINIALSLYYQDLKLRNLSSTTIANYKATLKILIDNWGGFDVSELTLDRIKKVHIIWSNRGLQSMVYRSYCITLRSFVKWCVEEGYSTVKLSRIMIPKGSPKRIECLNEDELSRAMSYLKSLGDDIREVRNFTIFYCLYTTGCRINELLSLDIDSIDWEQGCATILGKGLKLRPIFFTPECLTYIKNYLSLRKDPERPLFISHSDRKKTHAPKRLTSNFVQKYLRQIRNQLGFRFKVTPHVFRHTFATILMNKGADLKAVQNLLGHASLRSTERYLHISDERLKKSYLTFHYSPVIK